jgi:hypothetical protein
MDAGRFEPFGFTPEWIASNVHDNPDWNRDARVLTDQF